MHGAAQRVDRKPSAHETRHPAGSVLACSTHSSLSGAVPTHCGSFGPFLSPFSLPWHTLIYFGLPGPSRYIPAHPTHFGPSPTHFSLHRAARQFWSPSRSGFAFPAPPDLHGSSGPSQLVMVRFDPLRPLLPSVAPSIRSGPVWRVLARSCTRRGRPDSFRYLSTPPCLPSHFGLSDQFRPTPTLPTHFHPICDRPASFGLAFLACLNMLLLIMVFLDLCSPAQPVLIFSAYRGAF